MGEYVVSRPSMRRQWDASEPQMGIYAVPDLRSFVTAKAQLGHGRWLGTVCYAFRLHKAVNHYQR